MIVAFQSVFIYSDFAHHQYFVFRVSEFTLFEDWREVNVQYTLVNCN